MQRNAHVGFLSEPVPKSFDPGLVPHVLPLRQPDKINPCSASQGKEEESGSLLAAPLPQCGVLFELIDLSFEVDLPVVLLRPEAEFLYLDPPMLFTLTGSALRPSFRLGREGDHRGRCPEVESHCGVLGGSFLLDPLLLLFFLEDYLGVGIHVISHPCLRLV